MITRLALLPVFEKNNFLGNILFLAHLFKQIKTQMSLIFPQIFIITRAWSLVIVLVSQINVRITNPNSPWLSLFQLLVKINLL